MKLNGGTIAPDVVARIVERRGSEHCFAGLDPRRTALVVITTKQRTERIRSMALSIVALGPDRICDIIGLDPLCSC